MKFQDASSNHSWPSASVMDGRTDRRTDRPKPICIPPPHPSTSRLGHNKPKVIQGFLFEKIWSSNSENIVKLLIANKVFEFANNNLGAKPVLLEQGHV